MLEIKYHDGLARIGVLHTKHGKVELPVFCPVINPNKLIVEPKEMAKKFKVKMLMANSYIIFKYPDLREAAQKHKLHRWLKFRGAIMVDNGGYQLHRYKGVKIDFAEILRFQEEIGADIGITLDLPTSASAGRKEAERSVEVTLQNARQSLKLMRRKDMLWSAPVQGGKFLDLISRCSEELSKLPYTIHSLGEPVQFLNNYEFTQVCHMIHAAKSKLPINRAFHLFGVGLPSFMPLATLLGCDIFDSASYALFASDDRYMTDVGTLRLEEMHELPCNCEVCSKYDLKDLKEMLKGERERALALHNLYVLFKVMKEIREAIAENRLFELCAIRCRSHPKLFEAYLVALRSFSKLFQKYDPMRKRSGLFYTGEETKLRPEVRRAKLRVKKIFGTKLVPAALNQTYPFFQSLSIEGKPLFKFTEEKVGDLDRIRKIADYQFGKGVGRVLFPTGVKIFKSPTTGKIRRIYYGSELLATLRPRDGFLCLRIAGALRIKDKLRSNRVFIEEKPEVEELVGSGRNLFVKFVRRADPNILPRDEVLILNSKNELLAVGEAVLSSEEMEVMERGVAVKTREGIKARI